MTSKLFIQAIVKFLAGIVLLGVLIFLPAGSFSFWNGWLLMGILFIPMFIAGIVMMFKDPELLRKRLNARESEGEQKKVIDTGLYGIVRHPMYFATVLLFLSMGLVLGSPLSFAVLLLYIPLIAKRIRNEEEVLEKGLAGYSEYRKKVRYRLVPFIW